MSSQIDIDSFLSVGFSHHVYLIQKCQDLKERFFYMEKSAFEQWSYRTLQYHVESDYFHRKGIMTTNFKKTLPEKMQQSAVSAFKDEYLLSFINADDENMERVLENEIVKNIKDFMMALGKEFSFMGNQYRVVVDGEEFFVDLLFFHRGLQALVAIELKTGKFKPEYAGKMNFYLTALDEYVKLSHESPSIGIILCKEKSNTIVEFAFRRTDSPVGVGTYKLASKLPKELEKHLPAPEEFVRLLQKKPPKFVP